MRTEAILNLIRAPLTRRGKSTSGRSEAAPPARSIQSPAQPLAKEPAARVQPATAAQCKRVGKEGATGVRTTIKGCGCKKRGGFATERPSIAAESPTGIPTARERTGSESPARTAAQREKGLKRQAPPASAPPARRRPAPDEKGASQLIKKDRERDGN